MREMKGVGTGQWSLTVSARREQVLSCRDGPEVQSASRAEANSSEGEDQGRPKVWVQQPE